MNLIKKICNQALYPHTPASCCEDVERAEWCDDCKKLMKRRHVLWDDKTKGFGLRVHPPAGGNGKSRKTFLFRYEVGGRQRWLTIGTFGPMTVNQARDRADEHHVECAHDKDPAEERRRRRQELTKEATTLANVADAYFDELDDLSENDDAYVQPQTRRGYRQIFDNHLKKRFGARRPDEITSVMVAKMKRSMRDTPYQFNRARWLLGKLLATAEAHGLRTGANPCRGGRRDRHPDTVTAYIEDERSAPLGPDEVARFGAALRKLEDEGKVSTAAGAALRLLLLSGCRVNEILKLKWSRLDFDRGMAVIPEHKTRGKTRKPKIIPLTPAILDVLSTLPRDSEWVIRGQRPASHMVELKKPWGRVCKKARIEGRRIHDLRHTVGSWGVNYNDLSDRLVGGVLGHKNIASTKRYTPTLDDAVAAAATAISNGLAEAMQREPDDNVVELESRRRG